MNNDTKNDSVVELNETVDFIIRQLKLHPDDVTMMRHGVRMFLMAGWSPIDVEAYMSLTEEVNPDLEEAYALKRMASIAKKYQPNKQS